MRWIGKVVHRNDVLRWGGDKRLQEVQETVGMERELTCLKTEHAIATLRLGPGMRRETRTNRATRVDIEAESG